MSKPDLRTYRATIHPLVHYTAKVSLDLAFGYMFRSTNGRQIAVRGTENIPGDTICNFACNHVSYVDPPLVMWALYKYLGIKTHVAANEKLFIPGFRQFYQRMGCHPVPMRPGKDTWKVLINHYAKVQEKNNLLHFPQGSRGRNNKPMSWKSGITRSTLKAQLDNPDQEYAIIPTGITYERGPIENLIEKGLWSKITLPAKSFRRGIVSIEFFPPIDMSGPAKQYRERNGTEDTLDYKISKEIGDEIIRKVKMMVSGESGT